MGFPARSRRPSDNTYSLLLSIGWRDIKLKLKKVWVPVPSEAPTNKPNYSQNKSTIVDYRPSLYRHCKKHLISEGESANLLVNGNRTPSTKEAPCNKESKSGSRGMREK